MVQQRIDCAHHRTTVPEGTRIGTGGVLIVDDTAGEDTFEPIGLSGPHD